MREKALIGCMCLKSSCKEAEVEDGKQDSFTGVKTKRAWSACCQRVTKKNSDTKNSSVNRTRLIRQKKVRFQIKNKINNNENTISKKKSRKKEGNKQPHTGTQILHCEADKKQTEIEQDGKVLGQEMPVKYSQSELEALDLLHTETVQTLMRFENKGPAAGCIEQEINYLPDAELEVDEHLEAPKQWFKDFLLLIGNGACYKELGVIRNKLKVLPEVSEKSDVH